MHDAYDSLLDATIRHLEDLKGRGVKHVVVSATTMEGLNASGRARSSKNVSKGAAVAAQPSVGGAKRPVFPASAPKENPTGQTGLAGLPAELPAGPAAPQLSGEAKAAAFEDLRGRVLQCLKCGHLAASRKNVVFGVGDINAELMFVGEAPGADEDEQGEPFVGRAGQLLTRIIETMGLSRQSVYITNVLKCRPDTPGQSAGNRKPTAQEMQICIPYLHEQIDLIRPKVIVALGATAVEGLLGKTLGITRLRGHWQIYRGIPLMPTYHPAYLLRNQSLGEKRKVWEDMLQVMERLGLTPSEKQRRYFTK